MSRATVRSVGGIARRAVRDQLADDDRRVRIRRPHHDETLVGTAWATSEMLAESEIMFRADRWAVGTLQSLGAVERIFAPDAEIVLGTDRENARHVSRVADNDVVVLGTSDSETFDLDRERWLDVRRWTRHVARTRGWQR